MPGRAAAVGEVAGRATTVRAIRVMVGAFCKGAKRKTNLLTTNSSFRWLIHTLEEAEHTRLAGSRLPGSSAPTPPLPPLLVPYWLTHYAPAGHCHLACFTAVGLVRQRRSWWLADQSR